MTSCQLYPAHPGPPGVGIRKTGNLLLVHAGLCSGESVTEARVYRWYDTEGEKRRLLWSGSGPVSAKLAERGTLRLGDERDFKRVKGSLGDWAKTRGLLEVEVHTDWDVDPFAGSFRPSELPADEPVDRYYVEGTDGPATASQINDATVCPTEK